MTANAAVDGGAIGPRIQLELERTIQRYVKGWQFFSSPSLELGTTPKDLLHSRGTLNLWHYRPQAEEVYRVPLLLVMATTNRGYIFDLAPGQSFVEFLLKQGFDVYQLDWNPPRPEEKSLRLDDYVLDFIPDCMERLGRHSGEQEASIMGYCMGGVLSLIYAATHPAGPLKNLICLTTPVDWSEMGLFARWADRRFFDVDRLVDTLGNVPAEIILGSFEALRPAGRNIGQLQVWDNMWNDEYMKAYRMFDKWGGDILPLAGEYFRQIVKDLMWGNLLHAGALKVGGRTAALAKIKVPIIHAVAEHDHIVPYACSRPLIEKVGSRDKQEIMLKGGHVSVLAGGNAVKRLWPRLDAWLGERSV